MDKTPDPFSAAGRFEQRRLDAIQQRALEAMRRKKAKAQENTNAD